MAGFDEGPYVTAAFFCEKVLSERDGVHSYVRVIDKVVRPTISPELRATLPPERVELVLVLGLKAGEALGTFRIELEIERPSGQREASQAFTVTFNSGRQGGVNVHVNMALVLDQQGIWWIDVLGGDEQTLMTRVPLELQQPWIKGDPQPGSVAPS